MRSEARHMSEAFSMDERPRLVMTGWTNGKPIVYQCSLCSRTFTIPESEIPRDAMAKVWAAFTEHVREKHATADSE